MENHIVIMAGGIGSRFWPMSTPECPKQFIDVMGCGSTLIQLTAQRFEGICLPQHIWVVTSERYVDIVKEQLPQIPHSNILAEPCMRNTAPCIAYVSWKIKNKFPDANVVVTPSDQLVTDVEEFKKIISKGLIFVSKSQTILTIGITPNHPATGYGYIATSEVAHQHILKVNEFREKPDLKTAKGYLKAGNYLWNAGIFIWHIDTIISALYQYTPNIASLFSSINTYLYTEQETQYIKEYFPDCPNVSIDYAVMEKADNVFVYPASFGWSDVGTWGALKALLPQDERGNATIKSDIKLYDCDNCIVYTPHVQQITIQGLSECIIAEHNGKLLICRLVEEQRIKEFSNAYK